MFWQLSRMSGGKSLDQTDCCGNDDHSAQYHKQNCDPDILIIFYIFTRYRNPCKTKQTNKEHEENQNQTCCFRVIPGNDNFSKKRFFFDKHNKVPGCGKIRLFMTSSNVTRNPQHNQERDGTGRKQIRTFVCRLYQGDTGKPET